MDTVYSSNLLVHDRKGVKLGKYKYSLDIQKLLRVKMIVEKKFKFTSNLPDTIYILTSPESTACGYPFTPFVKNEGIPGSFYRYIVYGDKWIEKTIISSEKGKRNMRQIKETLLPNTFFTTICRRTQPYNERELNSILANTN